MAVATAVTPRPRQLRLRKARRFGASISSRLPRGGLARFALVLAWMAIVAGVVGRFLAPGGLWLDEALS